MPLLVLPAEILENVVLALRCSASWGWTVASRLANSHLLAKASQTATDYFPAICSLEGKLTTEPPTTLLYPSSASKTFKEKQKHHPITTHKILCWLALRLASMPWCESPGAVRSISRYSQNASSTFSSPDLGFVDHFFQPSRHAEWPLFLTWI